MSRLLPAIRLNGKLHIGKQSDSHDTLEAEQHITGGERGFAIGNKFLTRKAALGWLRSNDPVAYNKVADESKVDGLHSGPLSRAYGIRQKEKPKVDKVDLSNKTCIVFDRAGLYCYWARKIGKKFGKTLYYIPDSSAYPEGPKGQIGKGYPEIRRITDKEYFAALKKTDIVAFPDVYDGAHQKFLRDEGIPVFGSGLAERLEIDKIFFLETLEKLKLPVPYTEVADSIDDLINILSAKRGTWYLKGLWRGDFESRKHRSMLQTMNWLNQHLIPKLGESAKNTKVLIQKGIKSKIEIGYDGNRVRGVPTSNCIVGVETKDSGFVSKIFKEPPKIIKDFNDALTQFYAEHNYCGAYSNELRISDDGTAWPIDETCRVGSPPGELISISYRNYPESVYKIAKGEMPQLEPIRDGEVYGAELILTSPFYEEHEVCFEFPEEYDDNVMLKNCVKRGKGHYCIVNGNGSFAGAVAATGKSVKEATEKCLKIAEEITCEELSYNRNAFSESQKAIEDGRKFGVIF